MSFSSAVSIPLSTSLSLSLSSIILLTLIYCSLFTTTRLPECGFYTSPCMCICLCVGAACPQFTLPCVMSTLKIALSPPNCRCQFYSTHLYYVCTFIFDHVACSRVTIARLKRVILYRVPKIAFDSHLNIFNVSLRRLLD